MKENEEGEMSFSKVGQKPDEKPHVNIKRMIKEIKAIVPQI